MDKFKPADFWTAYREALRSGGSRAKYCDSARWTAVAVPAAMKVCTDRFGLDISKEDLRLDVMGWEPRDKFDWFLRIAYEHENDWRTWRSELCKLAHVVADLCVLSSYYGKRTPARAALQKAVDPLKERLLRVPGRQWLFVFGPRSGSPKSPFHAFSLDDKGRVVPLDDANPLRPESFRSKDG